MTRQEALDWLNYRVILTNQMKRHNHFTITDVEFFIKFIAERSGEQVHVNAIIDSIQYHPESAMDWVERLINYLVVEFNLQTETEQIPDILTNMGLGIDNDSLKILKYK
jgi:hypothetical protein